jgi:hypothetical protein
MFKWLLGTHNLTRDWPPYRGRSLTFDLTTGQLGEAHIGQGLEAASFLGPDEDAKAARNGELCYYSLGLCVGFSGPNPVIHDVSLVFRDPQDKRFRPFTGQIVYSGQKVGLRTFTPDQCTDLFGECFWVDEDGVEIIMFYEFDGREWQFEFDLNRSLNRLLVTDRPLMADQRQRESYNVTRPWPPSH